MIPSRSKTQLSPPNLRELSRKGGPGFRELGGSQFRVGIPPSGEIHALLRPVDKISRC
jgi:hypothetical protein